MKISDLMRDPKYRDESINNGDYYFTQLSEGSLSRLLSQSNKFDYAVITAYRDSENGKKLTKADNVVRNRQLRTELNSKKLGIHPLIGHWRESPHETIPYEQCPEKDLVDVIERSYFVVRMQNVSQEDFKELLLSLGKKYNQNAIIMKLGETVKLYYLNTGVEESLGTGITLGKLAQAYSQYVRNVEVPFVFEGIEYPECVCHGKAALRKEGFYW